MYTRPPPSSASPAHPAGAEGPPRARSCPPPPRPPARPAANCRTTPAADKIAPLLLRKAREACAPRPAAGAHLKRGAQRARRDPRADHLPVHAGPHRCIPRLHGQVHHAVQPRAAGHLRGHRLHADLPSDGGSGARPPPRGGFSPNRLFNQPTDSSLQCCDQGASRTSSAPPVYVQRIASVTGHSPLVSIPWSLSPGLYPLPLVTIPCPWSLSPGHYPLVTIPWSLSPAPGHYPLVTIPCPWSLSPGHYPLVTNPWSLATGHWPLATSHWSPVIGHWPLVTGHKSLASSR